MASITNLEELPQLVMEKITSFLNHKQLLAFEQVSRRLKCAVDDHFSVTDHLIIGPLPKVKYFDEPTAKEKNCLDGLLKIINRCGIRLRTIVITNTWQSPLSADPISNCRRYSRHFFASAELSNNCPNIENILVSPNGDITTILDYEMFRSQNVLLYEFDTESYANNIKLSTGGTCKLRSLQLSYLPETEATEHSYQRIVSLFSNLEQISVCKADENFYHILPQLMDNGLKDLSIVFGVNFRIAKKLCNICKDLRTLRFNLTVANVDDIAALCKLQMPKNAEIKVTIDHVDDVFSRLNENVCNAIINCVVFGPTDYSFMSKLKNLQEFNIIYPKQLRVIAEASFPKLRRIIFRTRVCNRRVNHSNSNMCYWQTFLPQLLINKGNQLTHIKILDVCKKSISVVWKALKHCKAAKRIRFHLDQVDSSSGVTYEDVAALCDLPNLEHFIIYIRQIEDENCLLRAGVCVLLERAVKEHTDFQFKYKCSQVSLYRINS